MHLLWQVITRSTGIDDYQRHQCFKPNLPPVRRGEVGGSRTPFCLKEVPPPSLKPSVMHHLCIDSQLKNKSCMVNCRPEEWSWNNDVSIISEWFLFQMPTSFTHKASHNASLRKVKFDNHTTSYKFNEILFGFFKVKKFFNKEIFPFPLLTKIMLYHRLMTVCRKDSVVSVDIPYVIGSRAVCESWNGGLVWRTVLTP